MSKDVTTSFFIAEKRLYAIIGVPALFFLDMMKDISYRIAPASEFSACDVQDYYDEFIRNGEECKALWLMAGKTAGEWVQMAVEDRADGTEYAGFYVNGRMVGVCRIKEKINFPQSGNFGYAIRPSERGKGYASKFITAAVESFVPRYGLEMITACVDCMNIRSIRAFIRAGWKYSGKTYEWPHERTAVELCKRLNER